MKNLNEYILETKGQPINQQWLDNNKPVMTCDNREVIITDIDLSTVPNIIKGTVNINGTKVNYEWEDNGKCIKASDKLGNPQRPDKYDDLVKAI